LAFAEGCDGIGDQASTLFSFVLRLQLRSSTKQVARLFVERRGYEPNLGCLAGGGIKVVE
jgi:hypothetical protein